METQFSEFAFRYEPVLQFDYAPSVRRVSSFGHFRLERREHRENGARVTDKNQGYPNSTQPIVLYYTKVSDRVEASTSTFPAS